MTDAIPSPARPVSGLHLIWLVAGFSVWASGFILLYGLHALGCRWGWEEAAFLGGISVNRAVLIGVYLAHIAAGAALWLPLHAAAKRWPGEGGVFLKSASVLLTVAAVVSTIWIGAPVLFLAACAG
ncbi:hypothetical protein FKB34_14200 [Glycocaulis profundi]|nr:hypothetical protein FKB34_14200 [Glycocaulis profundi]